MLLTILTQTRIVLVGHSMGGLVIKQVKVITCWERELHKNEMLTKEQAYILACQDPAFKDIASRFHSMYFLATPHRGADLARTLGNILKVTYGQKQYVNELEPTSGLLFRINDSFRHHSKSLQLWSFYETVQSSLIVANALVVDKASATMGYADERIALLNADHRGVCKFDDPSDPNYKTLRNAFSTTVDSINSEGWFSNSNLGLIDSM